MRGHIDVYLDCVSYYSYLALLYLQKNRAALASHDVTVELHPMFLGGVNVGSGNKPPWTLPAKAAYGIFDMNRAKNYHGVPEVSTAPFFPIMSLLPQRCMCYVKAKYPRDTYEKAFISLFRALWVTPHRDLSKPEILRQTLLETFREDEADAILAAGADAEWKRKLTANTEKVLKQGAFGGPWFWVKNGKGVEEPFFGSDRFHFMWEFLGLPWEDIRIVPKAEMKGRL